MHRSSFIFFGPPGSGKGTQAALLSKAYNIPAISLGQLLRQETENKTELGEKIEKFITEGELVPDQIVKDVIIRRLDKDDASGGFILDGYPRNESQAKDLKEILHGRKNHFIFIDVDDEEVKKRMALRNREDDKPEVIHTRLELYHTETRPVIKHLEEIGRIIHVNGNQGIEEIHKEIKDQLNIEL